MDSNAALQLIQRRFKESSQALDILASGPLTARLLSNIASQIALRLKKGRRVVVFGNGGSASQAEHFACELTGGFTNHRRPALDVIALSANTSSLSAIANDYCYEEVFSRQIEGYCRNGDVAIGLSTSGNSKNVLLALEKAKKMRCLTVALTGRLAGKMKTDKSIDLLFRAPSDSTPRIQEAHLAAIHSICELVEMTLFGPERS